MERGNEVGHVKFYHFLKKFGFIKLSNGPEVFFHADALTKPSEAGNLREGTEVRFTMAMGSKGPVALGLSIV